MVYKWHDLDELGKIIGKQIKKVDRLSSKNKDLDQNISVLHALCQASTSITNLKTVNETATKLDKIEKLLAYIPQEIMQEALVKINEQK